MQIYFLTFLIFLGLACASDVVVEYSGNLTEGSDNYVFRDSTVKVHDGNNLLWVSGSVASRGKAKGETGVNVNTILGFVHGGTGSSGEETYLWSWLTFARAKYDNYAKGDEFNNSVVGAIGSIIKKIEEFDKDDKLVYTYELKTKWSVTKAESKDKDGRRLSWATLETSNSKIKIRVTFIASSVPGVISYGNALVSPQSLQCVIEIEDFKYDKTDNYLKLTVGAVTADLSTDGNALISTNNETSVYFTVASSALIGGVKKEIKLSKYESATFGSQDCENFVKGLIKKEVVARELTITFPANAKNIIYDPTVGQGQVLYGASSGLVPSILLLALLAVLLH